MPGTGAPHDSGSSDPVARGMHAMLARREVALASGAEAAGWKVGFNSPAIQAHFGLRTAVVGYLLDTGVLPDAATVAVGTWTAPAVEVEVAIRVGEDGGVAGLAPALELVDLDLPYDDIEPILAGDIFQRGVVFGPEVAGADPWAVVATVRKAGEVVAEGRITEDPAETVSFVRAFLAEHGAELEPGHRIIGGSVVAPLPVTPGDALEVSFGPLGHLSVRFEA